MKHLLSIEKLPRTDLERILSDTGRIKRQRGHHTEQPLHGQIWALMFSKSSTRTRVSFEVGIRELGGDVIFLSSREIQLGRGEPIKDTARVLGRMVKGVVIRTFSQTEVEEFASYSAIPTINALTDEEHPCQILADLFTIQEKRGSLKDLVVSFIGDGACNVATSWIWAASKLGFELRIAAPRGYQPDAALLSRAGNVATVTEDLESTARGADVLYTDVWISMGKEAEEERRLKEFARYQINGSLLAHAKPGALVMHCLPAYRGKEIDDATFEAHAQTLFDQAENRLHAQKSILEWIVA